MHIQDSPIFKKLTAVNSLAELFNGQYGLEIEAHRIDQQGKLSRVPHPETLGNRFFHPYIVTDYAESQLELVTEPSKSLSDARLRLAQLEWVVREQLQTDAAIWPISMPPRYDQADLDWLDTTFKRTWYQDYRDWLKDKYGSTHATMTGVHVNISISPKLIQVLFDASDENDFVKFQNESYFKLAQAFAAHRWLLIYLFGAAPYTFNDNDSRIPDDISEPVRSLRGSAYGFANDADIDIDYGTSVEQTLSQMNTHIDEGKLFSAAEFYGTIRFKGDDVLEKGVSYLELRVLDTDPFDSVGISENTLNVIDLLAAHFILTDHVYSRDELADALALSNAVALQNPNDQLPNLTEAKELLSELGKTAELFPMRFNDGLSLLSERILSPSKTPASKMIQAAQGIDSLATEILETARERTKMFHVKHDELKNNLFADDTLTDTHIQALQLGLRVINYSDKELVLAFKDHREVVNQPTDLTVLFPELLKDDFFHQFEK